MTAHSPITTPSPLDQLAQAAAGLGYEIVDIAGFLDLVEGHAATQKQALGALGQSADEVSAANDDAGVLAQALGRTSDKARADVQNSVTLVRHVSDKTRSMAAWVAAVHARAESVGQTLDAVKTNNSQIATIAAQVNTLAINAKIEAARAGNAGLGFAVVANAINDLSRKTSIAARQISQNIEDLTERITTLGLEAESVAEDAHAVLDNSTETDAALKCMEETITLEHAQCQQIAKQTLRVKDAMARLSPAVAAIGTSVHETTEGIETTHSRMVTLVNASEKIVQISANLGGASGDAPFIKAVQDTAQEISTALDLAVETGQIGMGELFDRHYMAIAETNPPQVLTRSTRFLDSLLPQHQEPVLDFDPKVVFCAAVDVNGYLPTHNAKFSHPQGPDVVWNTSHARNRRIFDDRVGLKAGRSTDPFLLQVYRRDMGGGHFRLMKDLSAPIWVCGRHWGGLRLGYQHS